jgi:hypothetical protein
MTRITTTIMVFLIILNGVSTVMIGSGLADDLGMQLGTGADETVAETQQNASAGFSANQGGGSTLFGLFVSAMGTFNDLIGIVFSAPQMFLNLGFPSWIVLPFFGPMYAVATLELIYVATGRDTV